MLISSTAFKSFKGSCSTVERPRLEAEDEAAAEEGKEEEEEELRWEEEEAGAEEEEEVRRGDEEAGLGAGSRIVCFAGPVN